MSSTFDYHGKRAHEARLGKLLNTKLVKFTLFFLAFAFVFLGTALILKRSPWGWLPISCAIPSLLPLYWIKHQLANPPVGKGDSYDDILSGQLLAILPKHFTVDELIELSDRTASGNFITLRYGISAQSIKLIAADNTATVDQVFAEAKKIKEELSLPDIDGGTIQVAMVRLAPFSEEMLRHIKLDIDALYDGLRWFDYLTNTFATYKKSKNNGGVGRDLDFGYSNLLSRFAVNISARYANEVEPPINIPSHREIVDQLVKIFSEGGRQNAALIGQEGSGRSTIIRNFAARIMDADAKIDNSLRFRQIFQLDAAALISAGGERGQLENLITQILNEAYHAKNIILWLDNAELFFQEETGAVNLTNVIAPILAAGNLRIIMTLNQQRFLEISAKNPMITNAINRINVEPSNERETIDVMQDKVPFIEFNKNTVITYWALVEAYRLSSRYIQDLAMPGQAIALLEAAANFPDPNNLVTDQSVQEAVEKTFGVKMQSTQTDEDREKLLDLENRIHERMIDQVNAVKAVSNALRRAAAGVRNENRPIGTFLFLGPTGVGKTELAKAISDVYFNGESQLVRIDLNEYVSANDVARLIADGAENELSLTAQISKRPFSVVLLDEIEKAHPQVLTTLLQLLDEGILRDTKNREVSFRDAIVVATSNAGADFVRDYIDRGENLTLIKDELTNELIKNGDFKPEFLNRFDEICIFEPLSKESLVKIIDLIIKGVNVTLAPRKITVTLDQAAKELLVERGYDPKLGARPMRRIVQSTVEDIIAKLVLAGTVNPGSDVNLTADDIRAQLAE